MHINKKLFFSFSIFLLSACTSLEKEEIQKNDTIITEPKTIETYSAEKVDVYFEKDTTLSLYEPENGVYLGAYILSNKYVNFSIEAFEETTNKEHSMYMYHTKIGNPFPQDFVLGCIANLKAPYIVLSAENQSNPFDKSKMVETAKRFGEFYVPIFIEFYPNMRTRGYNPQEYIEFYRYTHEVFREHATNVAFVFSVSDNEIPDFLEYYPGEEYVDWVSLNLSKKVNENGNLSYLENNVFDKIDYVYHVFQEKKPIVISGLAISHFSTVNHVYHSDEAGREIDRIYAIISERYPRIKAINYMDYNSIDPVNRNFGKDNFSITENQTILSYYHDTVKKEAFLQNIDFSSGGEEVRQLMKSAFYGYKIADDYYISEYSIRHELNYDENLTDFIEIDEKKYINISVLGCNYDIMYDRIIFKK